MIFSTEMSLKKQWAIVKQLVNIESLNDRSWKDDQEIGMWHSYGDCKIDRRRLNVELEKNFKLLHTDDRGKNRTYLVNGFIVLFQYDNHVKSYLQMSIQCTEERWNESYAHLYNGVHH